MSKEAVEAFLKKLADDEALQRDLVLFAAERGYEFTIDELGESELDRIAGGALTAPPKILDPLDPKVKVPTIPTIAGSGGEDR